MSGITMFDTAFSDQFPAGAQAYAAYVDGGVGDQPNYAHIVSAFPNEERASAGDSVACRLRPGGGPARWTRSRA